MKTTDIIWIAVLAAAVIAIAAGVMLLSGCSEDKPKDEKTAELSFHSYDGGGPEYDFSIEDPDVAEYTTERVYDKPNHEKLEGAGYDIVVTLKGKKAGETVLTASCSTGGPDSDITRFRVTVENDLSVSTEVISDEATNAVSDAQEMIVIVSGHTFYAEVADNPCAAAFWERLEKKSLVVSLTSRDDQNKKSGAIEEKLPAGETQDSAQAGDLVLYGDDEIALCSGECPGECTLLATLIDFDENELKKALENEPAELTLLSDWPER